MPTPHLPAELLDHIIDHLHDDKRALSNCCLVSKSWIPRTRKHLFANIHFFDERDLRWWKRAFPDPSTSPARYAKSIFIGSPRVLEDAEANGGGWLRPFSRVTRMAVKLRSYESLTSTVPLVSFHGFSPVIKSLYLSFIALPPPHIFDLIVSFPLLEHLCLVTRAHDKPIHYDDGSGGLQTAAQPSSPPKLTGSLALFLMGGTELIICQLLSLPGGIHFRKLTWTWFYERDLLPIMRLVEECSQTLKVLRVVYELSGTFIRHMCPS